MKKFSFEKEHLGRRDLMEIVPQSEGNSCLLFILTWLTARCMHVMPPHGLHWRLYIWGVTMIKRPSAFCKYTQWKKAKCQDNKPIPKNIPLQNTDFYFTRAEPPGVWWWHLGRPLDFDLGYFTYYTWRAANFQGEERKHEQPMKNSRGTLTKKSLLKQQFWKNK